MSHNTFGHLLRVTTFGESHGPALGCIVDGCPPNIRLTVEDIQTFLDKRRPGQSRFTTQRQEPDQVKILSGVFEDDRTGGPVDDTRITATTAAVRIEFHEAWAAEFGETIVTRELSEDFTGLRHRVVGPFTTTISCEGSSCVSPLCSSRSPSRTSRANGPSRSSRSRR